MVASEKKIRMPSIAYVVARSYPGNVIGCENRLPWHLRSDMKRFRQITKNHVVIMGRKTLESIGKPLPDRINIVLSRHPEKDQPHLVWAKNKETALFLADVYSIMNGQSEFFVIGGSEVYRIFESDFYRIHLTEVFAQVEGDAHFNFKFDKRKWKVSFEEDAPADEENDYASRYMILDNREENKRYRFSREFLTDSESLEQFLELHLAHGGATRTTSDNSMAQQFFPKLEELEES